MRLTQRLFYTLCLLTVAGLLSCENLPAASPQAGAETAQNLAEILPLNPGRDSDKMTEGAVRGPSRDQAGGDGLWRRTAKRGRGI